MGTVPPWSSQQKESASITRPPAIAQLLLLSVPWASHGACVRVWCSSGLPRVRVACACVASKKKGSDSPRHNKVCRISRTRSSIDIDEREKLSVTRCRPFSGPTSPTSLIPALPALYQPYQPYTGPTGPIPALDGHAEQLRLSNFHRSFVDVDQLAREVINSHGSS